MEEIRQELKNKTFEILRTESFEKLDPRLMREFGKVGEEVGNAMEVSAFEACREALAADKDLTAFDAALQRTFVPLEKNGLLEKIGHLPDEGSQAAIFIRPQGSERWTHQVNIDDVRVEKVRAKIIPSLQAELKTGAFTESQAEAVARFCGPWVESHLPLTLQYDLTLSVKEAEKALADLKPVMDSFTPGTSRLAEQGRPLAEPQMALLRMEHATWRSQLTLLQLISHSLATCGMYLSLYTLCGFYIAYRRPDILNDMSDFATLLAAAVLAVGACWFCAGNQWRAEIVPLLIFGMTVAIAFEKELALLLAASVSLVVALSLEQGLSEFVILVASVAAAIVAMGRIRSGRSCSMSGSVRRFGGLCDDDWRGNARRADVWRDRFARGRCRSGSHAIGQGIVCHFARRWGGVVRLLLDLGGVVNDRVTAVH